MTGKVLLLKRKSIIQKVGKNDVSTKKYCILVLPLVDHGFHTILLMILKLLPLKILLKKMCGFYSNK